MAIPTAMNNNNNQENNNEEDDEHEHGAVMPGFRFHPTEEELVEFYLRRKMEGKRFDVELITFLDLYRYDPWELPALAAIGEKEWYFYVPRDKKYRNGDRPNRVTTSGYWKATGADKMIRSDQNHHRSIGLKKTLVFYSGKAPKGIRTSWIMNEYRLPHHETERLQKAEISLCRVYKRAGMENHPSLPRSALPTRTSSSSRVVSQLARKQNEATSHNLAILSSQQTSPISSSSTNNIDTYSLAISNHNSYNSSQDDDRIITNLHQSHASIDELVIINNNNFSPINHNFLSHYNFSTLQPQPPLMSPGHVVPAVFSGRSWDSNAILEAGKDYTNSYSSN